MPAYYPLIAIAAAGLALWLMFRLVQASRARVSARAGFFDALKPLFDRVQTRLDPTGFPRMTGHRGDLTYEFRALPDTLTFRKLPALWVMVTLPGPLPVGASLDIMIRPAGNEPFSGYAELPHHLPCPDFLPDGTGVRSDDAARVPPESLIAPYAGVFDDPKVKELLITPMGMRIVVLAEEADRGRYLIFRDAEMGMTPLPQSQIAPVVDLLAALRQDLIDWAAREAK